MALTDEQRKRIRENRERALQLQKLRQTEGKEHRNDDGDSSNKKKRKNMNDDLLEEEGNAKSSIMKSHDLETKHLEHGEPSEGLETSEWVTKKEAMSAYCLPEGTLAVCECKEQDNPHNKSWARMKLYRRAELLQRAHARFGGPAGLEKEKNRRSDRKFFKDFGGAKDLFR
jgi:hypothetical protein